MFENAGDVVVAPTATTLPSEQAGDGRHQRSLITLPVIRPAASDAR
jgi:hypothetical protein